MKKTFTAPEVLISKFAQRDIITTSGGYIIDPTTGGFKPGQGGPIDIRPGQPIIDPEDFV